MLPEIDLQLIFMPYADRSFSFFVGEYLFLGNLIFARHFGEVGLVLQLRVAAIRTSKFASSFFSLQES